MLARVRLLARLEALEAAVAIMVQARLEAAEAAAEAQDWEVLDGLVRELSPVFLEGPDQDPALQARFDAVFALTDPEARS